MKLTFRERTDQKKNLQRERPIEDALTWREAAMSADEDDDDNDVRLVLKLGFLMRRVGNDNERFELRREREEREGFVVVGVLVGVVDLRIKATVVVVPIEREKKKREKKGERERLSRNVRFYFTLLYLTFGTWQG